MAQRFWDTLTRKNILVNNDKLLVGNDATGGVNYTNLSDLLNYFAVESENHIEFRFSLTTNPTVPPQLNKTERDPAGWTVNTPTNVTENDYVWMTVARLTLEGNLVDQWSSPVRLTGLKGVNGEPGAPGQPGQPGSEGSHFEFRYAKNGSFTVPPALNQTQRTPAGWATIVPSVLPGEYLWETRASISANDTLIGSWSNAIRSTGIIGGDGLNQATVTLYLRTETSTKPPRPTNNVTYTFLTGATSQANNGWLRDMPAQGGSYRWMIQASAIGSGTTDTIAPGDWTEPVIVAENGKSGPSLIMRGDWSATEQYSGTPEIVHIVKYNGKGYLTRTDAGIIPPGTPPTNTDYWNEFTNDIDALIVDFLVAYSAYIQNLVVGNLRTGVTGDRLEILTGENKLSFFQGQETDPSVELGIKAVEVDLGGISTPEPIYENLAGVFVKDERVQLTSRGIRSNTPAGMFAGIYSGSQKTHPADLLGDKSIFAAVVGKGDYTSGTYGGFFETLLINPTGLTVLKPHPYVLDQLNYTWYEEKSGWTGVHNGMEYVDGVAIGPV